MENGRKDLFTFKITPNREEIIKALEEFCEEPLSDETDIFGSLSILSSHRKTSKLDNFKINVEQKPSKRKYNEN